MLSGEIQTDALVTDWTKVPVDQVADGIKRQMVVGQNVMVCRFTFDPFLVTPEHTHPHEQMTIVVKGKVKFTNSKCLSYSAPDPCVLRLTWR